VDIGITQKEADVLIAMEKHDANPSQVWDFPSTGGSISVPLVSADKREPFLLDVTSGRIDLKKGTYQNRARKVIILVRLDFGGQPHRNPDGVEISSPHLHRFRENYGDKWAEPLPQELAEYISDRWELLNKFMEFCNITRKPYISKELFT
jgi:hypothetical protein